jgi:hypothetical protein
MGVAAPVSASDEQAGAQVRVRRRVARPCNVPSVASSIRTRRYMQASVKGRTPGREEGASTDAVRLLEATSRNPNKAAASVAPSARAWTEQLSPVDAQMPDGMESDSGAPFDHIVPYCGADDSARRAPVASALPAALDGH